MKTLERKQKSESNELYKRACQVMPGGCSRNTVLREPHPLYASYGNGCYVTDIEGVERIDFGNNMASLIHGHAHPAVLKAVTEQLSKGTAFTMATEVEVEYAEHICSRNEAFENIRFVNSGTEAVMGCLKAARAYTGRPKVAKTEGAYHGLYDFAEVSQTANPSNWGDRENPTSVPVSHGTPNSTLQDVVVIPFNDPELAIKILDRHKDELSCVLLDLMPHRIGLMPASKEFVDAIYTWTRNNSVLFICDEVITFRSNYGGAQEYYGIRPDLTALGKMIGGGFPVGALAGNRDVMQVMNPLADPVLFPHSGTFSANPITMTAGLASMQLYDKDAVEYVNELAIHAKKGINEAISISGINATVAGAGSMFRVHLKESLPVSYRDAYASSAERASLKKLLGYLFDHGVMMINTCTGTISTAMGQKEIERLSETFLDAFRYLQRDT